MKTAKQLELDLLVKECKIQQLKRDYNKEIERLQDELDYYKKGFAELHKRIDDVMDFIYETQEQLIITDFDLDYIRRVLVGDDKDE